MTDSYPILIIEPQDANRRHLADILAQLRHPVVEGDLSTLATALTGQSVGVVMVALEADDMNSLVTAARIRETPGGADIPIVAMTSASGDALDRLLMLTAQINIAVTVERPINPVSLAGVLRQIRPKEPARDGPKVYRGKVTLEELQEVHLALGKQSYFERLGVAEDAEDALVKLAFMRVRKRYKRENLDDDDRENRRLLRGIHDAVGQAYTTLRDVEKRKQYVLRLNANLTTGRGSRAGHDDEDPWASKVNEVLGPIQEIRPKKRARPRPDVVVDPRSAGGAARPDPRSSGAAKPDPRSSGAARPDPRSSGTTRPDPRSSGTARPDPRSSGMFGSAPVKPPAPPPLFEPPTPQPPKAPPPKAPPPLFDTSKKSAPRGGMFGPPSNLSPAPPRGSGGMFGVPTPEESPMFRPPQDAPPPMFAPPPPQAPVAMRLAETAADEPDLDFEVSAPDLDFEASDDERAALDELAHEAELAFDFQAPEISSSGDPDMLMAAAHLQSIMGEYGGAAQLLGRAVKARPNDVVLRYQLELAQGRRFTALGEPEKATTHYRLAVELAPAGEDSARAELEALTEGTTLSLLDRIASHKRQRN